MERGEVRDQASHPMVPMLTLRSSITDEAAIAEEEAKVDAEIAMRASNGRIGAMIGRRSATTARNSATPIPGRSAVRLVKSSSRIDKS